MPPTQEPGTAEEIAAFCPATTGVTVPTTRPDAPGVRHAIEEALSR